MGSAGFIILILFCLTLIIVFIIKNFVYLKEMCQKKPLNDI
jgi:hypothetical protein